MKIIFVSTITIAGLSLSASAASVILDQATINASSEVSGATITGTPSDLGTSTLTYTDFTIVSTNNGSASNIFAEDLGSGIEMVQIGNNGDSGFKSPELSGDELMTVNFNQSVNLSQVILNSWGDNDDPAFLGLAGDPGVVTISTFTETGAVDGDNLEAQPNGYDYDAVGDLLTLRIDGFARQIVVNFENSVTLNSFTVTSGSTFASAGGIGFGGFTYSVVPEPSTAALIGIGGLAFILRRRRS